MYMKILVNSTGSQYLLILLAVLSPMGFLFCLSPLVASTK